MITPESVGHGSLRYPDTICVDEKAHIWSEWVLTEDHVNDNGQRNRTYTSNCGVCNATKAYHHYNQEETK